MKKVLRTICWIVVFLALVWTVIAIANGKIMGDRVFMAAKDDMLTALALCAAAAIAALVLLATRPVDNPDVLTMSAHDRLYASMYLADYANTHPDIHPGTLAYVRELADKLDPREP